MNTSLTCPGCLNRRVEPDGWCLVCAPSWVRIARATRQLRSIRLTGRDVGPGSASLLLCRIRHSLNDAQVGRVLAALEPPAPVMPTLASAVTARCIQRCGRTTENGASNCEPCLAAHRARRKRKAAANAAA